jgi:hypothetical protein
MGLLNLYQYYCNFEFNKGQKFNSTTGVLNFGRQILILNS